MANAKLSGAPMRADHPAADMSPADVAAHEAASYVRRVIVPEPSPMPPLPTELRARRREITRRGW